MISAFSENEASEFFGGLFIFRDCRQPFGILRKGGPMSANSEKKSDVNNQPQQAGQGFESRVGDFFSQSDFFLSLSSLSVKGMIRVNI